MKKIFYLISIFTIMLMTLFSINVKAASLDSINIETDKAIVNPGEEVTLKIEFGKSLGAYTFDIAYDNNLLEFISASDGTPNDMSTKVRIVYYDSTGGSNAKDSLEVVFKAKEDITTSNPTDLSITAEGLANGDASEQYDDIDVPITKNITVEPDYKDYELNLQYDGKIIKNEEKEITITTISEMGKYYDHARLIAEVTTQTGGNVTLIGTDEQQLEHDLIQSGWGDPSGYKIGGKVNQVLKFTGLFTEVGEYQVTLKLIDRDSSDSTIAEKTFNIDVVEKEVIEDNDDENNNGDNENTEGTTENKPNNSTENDTNNIQKEENLPQELPKTGINYTGIIIAIIVLAILIYFTQFKKKNKLIKIFSLLYEKTINCIYNIYRAYKYIL